MNAYRSKMLGMTVEVSRVLNEKIAELEEQLSALRLTMQTLAGNADPAPPTEKRRRISPEGRARISSAAKKRWAEYRRRRSKVA